jgi:hypothetical protein
MKKSYEMLMQEAKNELEQWDRDKKNEKNTHKEKYRAQRLAKLHMRDMLHGVS